MRGAGERKLAAMGSLMDVRPCFKLQSSRCDGEVIVLGSYETRSPVLVVLRTGAVSSGVGRNDVGLSQAWRKSDDRANTNTSREGSEEELWRVMARQCMLWGRRLSTRAHEFGRPGARDQLHRVGTRQRRHGEGKESRCTMHDARFTGRLLGEGCGRAAWWGLGPWTWRRAQAGASAALSVRSGAFWRAEAVAGVARCWDAAERAGREREGGRRASVGAAARGCVGRPGLRRAFAEIDNGWNKERVCVRRRAGGQRTADGGLVERRISSISRTRRCG
ncbi:hypothetical protein OH77DRAFT_930753 [Trametes cingulata]|nr:hypothetical protein OH77DRAFT_930753 [Trametes cingulata]